MTQAIEPQAVLAPLSETALFLVLTVNAGAESDVRNLLSDLTGLTRSVGFRAPDAGLSGIAGVGSALWNRLDIGTPPAFLHPFNHIVGTQHNAPSTPGDLLFHIKAKQMDVCFELAKELMDRLANKVTVVDETHGFRYFELRDLLGFVDGTENPAGRSAREVALVGDEDPNFAGGSYVIVQKYLHNLTKWNSLPIEDQERIVGRTKLSNIELGDDLMPANSHVALNTIVDDSGEEHQILRYNMPFGALGTAEFGTYFIGYARDPAVTEQMLHNMFIGKPPGSYDRILDYSTAVTGGLFFVPSVDFLESLA
ncbi:MAG: Dyp-type peroxidase [Ferrimicrobium sp.]